MSENESIMQNDEVRLYELGLNLVTTLDDQIKIDFEKVKDTVKKHGGEVKTESVPVAIPLAYTMFKNVDSKNIKHNNASFGWVKFEATPDKIELIKEDLDLNSSILRYVILKTTEDANTSAETISEELTKKSETGDKRRSKGESEDVEEVIAEVEEVTDVEEVSSEEIDEAIDSLVEETK